MPEPIYAQQILCPNCNRAFSKLSPFETQVECIFCHTVCNNPLVTQKEFPFPERIIPFQTTEMDFEKRLVAHLIKHDHVPQDIFDCFSANSTIKSFVPMYLYEGNYQSSWTCKIGEESNEVHASLDGKSMENKTVKKYRPYSGTSRGNFAFLCLAYEGDDIPQQLKNFCSQFEYQAHASREYDSSYLGIGTDEEAKTFIPDTDKDLPWKKYGEQHVDSIARAQAARQLTNQDYKDLMTSTSFELLHKGRFVMVPFWFIYYSYKQDNHYFLMDGLGDKRSMTIPQDQEEIARVKKLWSQLTTAWIAPLLGILPIWYYTCDLWDTHWVGLILLAIWLGVCIWYSIYTNDVVTGIMQESLAARKAGALRMGFVTPEELETIGDFEEKAGTVSAEGNQLAVVSGAASRSRMIYVVLAIFLGIFGVHNFYAKRHIPGAIQLGLTVFSGGTLSVISWIWALRDAFANKTDGEGNPLQ